MQAAGIGDVVKQHVQEDTQQCSTYLFPPVRNVPGESTIIPTTISGPNIPKGHTRSASASGVGTMRITSAGSAGVVGRPSALKQNRGHQRALSHGQIAGVDAPVFQKGHSRVGSKTDFILPPGHREPEEGTSSFKGPNTHGHSRQASTSDSIYTLRHVQAASFWSRFRSLIFRRNRPAEESKYRVIVPTHLVSQHPRKSPRSVGQQNNAIRTTKYTILSFLPKNLLEQFHRVANLYFLFIVLLNWFPAINAFGKEIAMIPVFFVLGVTAVKDLFEDRRRHASDKRINNSTCRVYNRITCRYQKKLWKDVHVGEFIHLSNNEVIPADILLLRTSDPQGLCYIDTCNLDGETNLKPRQVARGFVDQQDSFDPSRFESLIEVDLPTTKIYRFHGAIIHPTKKRIPVGTDNLLLRDCVIKNTDFVEGIVVYAGHETKAMLNNGGPRYKRSSLERQMNIDIIWCVFILVFLCIIGAVSCKLWLSSYDQNVPFLDSVKDAVSEGFLSFWTFIIILQVMIPLSLYVTIEMTKLIQVYHIHQDVKLYDAETDKRIECRALNISEELGQIQYIFSDKTGTLTENKMIFRRCVVGGLDYNHPNSDNSQNSVFSANIPSAMNLNSDLEQELKYSRDPSADTVNLQGKLLQEFLLLLALCNTVVVSNHPHHDKMNESGLIESSSHSVKSERKYARLNESRSVTPSPPPTGDIPISSRTIIDGKPIYEAESPDELALVDAAYRYGCRLLRRGPHYASVCLPGGAVLEFQILQVLPFDTTRKCMSVIMQHPITQEIILYCKGADSTIFPHLAPISDAASEEILVLTQQHLNSYARQGLRVLVMAKRVLSESEYIEWLQRHSEAELAQEGRERKLRESYFRIETNLILLGATGIEDRLQDGVPETIASLIGAGIVLWVLTGDKPETAINIAYSARLFLPQMELLKLSAHSRESAERTINFYLAEIERELQVLGASSGQVPQIGVFARATGPINVAPRVHLQCPHRITKKRALVVDGKTLTIILDKRANLQKPFLELAQFCSSVLCCRATPLQKAYIVKIVKEQLKMRTLAIGDGANDVSMIQTADVGIGISGNEGKQAVMASDFAISKFRYLERLLLVHGHWCYDRLTRMVLYFFYKNATIVFLIFWFQLYCGFSGSVMIDQMYLMLYNLLFTSLPPIAIGVYDQDLPEEILLSRPSLYRQGRLALVYQPHSFWITMADALYQSIAIFFICEGAYHDTDVGIWEFGTTVTTSCMYVMLLHVAIETRSWTVLHVLSILVSLIAFYAFSLVYNTVCLQCFGLPSNYWVIQQTMGSVNYWAVVVLSTVVALTPRFLWRVVETCLFPGENTCALLERQQAAHNRGEDFLVSWSRSTSTSSIFRAKDVNASSLTVIG